MSIGSLYIRVHFITGCYHGSEWPPAPMRLFQALVAGAGAAHGMSSSLPESVVDAFVWLEGLQAPRIWASLAEMSSNHVISVPNNDDDKSMEAFARGATLADVTADRRKRYTMKPTPRRLVDTPVVYEWSFPSDEEHKAASVADLAKNVYCLGRGIDAAWAEATVDGQMHTDGVLEWVPQEAAVTSTCLRVPVKGSLDSLIARQQARRVKVERGDYVDPRTIYREVSYSFESVVDYRPFSIYRLHALDGQKPISWKQSDGVTLAAMTRHALMQSAPKELLGFVSGHNEKDGTVGPRLSWVPLPSVGHQHADGRIRRIMVLGPRRCDPDVFREAVFGIQFATLSQDDQERALITEMRGELDGAIRPYFATAQDWYSVSPVILPGFVTNGRQQPFKINTKKLESLVIKAFAQEGYPELEEVFIQKAPFHNGSHLASDYRVASYMSYPRFHIKVRLCRPASGPILVGVGRHYGLGLFAGL